MFEVSLKKVSSILDGFKGFENFRFDRLKKLQKTDLIKEESYKISGNSKKYTTERLIIEGYLSQMKQFDDEEAMTPVKYKRAIGYTFGRVYPVGSLSLCTMRREIRQTVAKDFYVDIDAENCHPQIVYQTCKYNKIECMTLEEYVNNRDEILKKTMKLYNVSRDQAKKLFIILLYFGSFETWIKAEKLSDDLKPNEFITKFIEDRNTYGKYIEDANEDIYLEVQQNKTKANKFEYNEMGSVVSIWCQEIENRILEEIVKYCKKMRYIINNVVVLCYDGIMIEKNKYNKKMLKEFNELIKSKFGYDLTYTEKEMKDHYIDILDEHIKKDEEVKEVNINDFFKDLETWGHRQSAELYYKIDSGRYIYSDKLLNWYEYNENNILVCHNYIPPSMMNNISKVLEKYLIDIRNKMMPNDPNYIKNCKNINKLLKDVSNATYIKNAINFIESLATIKDVDKLIDENKNLIAFNNKVYDKTTKTIRDIKKDDYICKNTGYKYEKSDKKKREEIERLIYSIFEDKQMVDYLLKVKCEALFGNNDELCIIQTGSGGNGKGVINTLDANSLGDYYQQTENTFITSKYKAGSANPTLYNSKSKRYIIIPEPEEENEFNQDIGLNTPFLKLITGKDKIITRDLHKSNIEFYPLFTPFIQCNKLPNIKNVDKAIIRRMRVIHHPFNFVDKVISETDRKIDKTLKDKISNIDYAREYLLLLLEYVDKIIETPQKVEESTKNYLTENNPVKCYIDEHIIIEKGEKIKSSILKEHFDDHNEAKLTMPLFLKAMTANGIENYMSMGYRYFRNIKIKEEPKQEEPENKYKKRII